MSLIAAETNGESQDTEALYRAHGAAVARLCRSLLRDRGEAEDATQQVFLSVHRALLGGAAPREPLPWLLAIARNECYSRFRQRAVPVAEAADGVAVGPDASVHVLRAGELADMWDEVGQMPTAQRKAFLLREIRGLSYGQLAEELSLTPPSVRSLLLRARNRLRHRLGEAAAGLGGAPWIQALYRLVAGGTTASPVPAAARAAAVGIGALTLAGGGGLVARHVTRSASAAAPHHVRTAHVNRVAAPPPAAVMRREGADSVAGRGSQRAGSQPDARSGEAHEQGHGRSEATGSGDVRSAQPGSSERSGDHETSSDSSSGNGHDGSNDPATAPEQSRNDGAGGGGDSASSSGSGSSTGGSDGGSPTGSRSGSDGESGGTSTVVSSGPADSSGSGSDGNGGGGSSDGGTGIGTDG